MSSACRTASAQARIRSGSAVPMTGRIPAGCRSSQARTIASLDVPRAAAISETSADVRTWASLAVSGVAPEYEPSRQRRPRLQLGHRARGSTASVPSGKPTLGASLVDGRSRSIQSRFPGSSPAGTRRAELGEMSLQLAHLCAGHVRDPERPDLARLREDVERLGHLLVVA